MVPVLEFFAALNFFSIDSDNGTFNHSSTGVVEKVNFLVVAAQHRGTSVAEGSPYHVDRNSFVLTAFHGGNLPCGFSRN